MDSVRIGVHEIPVEGVDSPDLEDNARWAEYDARRNVIRVSVMGDRPPSALAEAIVHEALHAMFLDSGLRQHPGWEEDIEEATVEALSPRLTAFLADNAGAIRSLWGMLGVLE